MSRTSAPVPGPAVEETPVWRVLAYGLLAVVVVSGAAVADATASDAADAVPERPAGVHEPAR
jgi:hypothetical protein